MRQVVLTYHRIKDRGEGWKSHDVPWNRFISQMRQVALRVQKEAHESPVEVTFDDGTAEHLEAARVLSQLGLVGTFFVISGRLQKTGYLSPSDVRAIASLGHRIGSHSVTHRHLPSLNDSELHAELSDSRKCLADLVGRDVDWLAPPGGVLDGRSLAAATSAGYKVVRTMDWGYAQAPLLGRVSCMPIFGFTTDRHLKTILEGRASSAMFRAKELVKILFGDNTYTVVREGMLRFLRRGRG
jgi:peptidoglycan/xylan/chitin deacetylase (PgdA/CDA1 family)